MACVDCHKAKVKCRRLNEDDEICTRCVRLKIACIPHISMQGRIKKVKRDTSSNRKRALVDRPLETERLFVKDSKRLLSHKYHYGTNHMIRQWILLAFRRRSFRLLEAATKLANRTDISMDQILKGQNLPDKWFATPSTRDISSAASNLLAGSGGPNSSRSGIMTISQVPVDVKLAMRCANQEEVCVKCPTMTACDPLVHQRWVFMRETKGDQVRFFVSDNFARDIASMESIQQTWSQNEKEVRHLWWVDTKDKTYSQNFIHLIRSYMEPNSHPEPIRSNGKMIKLRDGTRVMVDFIHYYRIMDLDASYGVYEFIPPRGFVSPLASLNGPFKATNIMSPPAFTSSIAPDMSMTIGDLPSSTSSLNESSSAHAIDMFEDFPNFESLPHDPDLEWIGDLIFDEMASDISDGESKTYSTS